MLTKGLHFFITEPACFDANNGSAFFIINSFAHFICCLLFFSSLYLFFFCWLIIAMFAHILITTIKPRLLNTILNAYAGKQLIVCISLCWENIAHFINYYIYADCIFLSISLSLCFFEKNLYEHNSKTTGGKWSKLRQYEVEEEGEENK